MTVPNVRRDGTLVWCNGMLGAIEVPDELAGRVVRAPQEHVPFVSWFSRPSLDEVAPALGASRRALEALVKILHMSIKRGVVGLRFQLRETIANRVELLGTEYNVLLRLNEGDVVEGYYFH
jgi:hypothetical protein